MGGGRLRYQKIGTVPKFWYRVPIGTEIALHPFKIIELRKLIIFFSDQEINNECLAVCDAEYFNCSKNCENSDCLRKCGEEVIGNLKKKIKNLK